MSRHEHQQSGTWLSSVGRALPPLGVVLLTLAWVWWSAVPKPAQLVLITIDTTRADRLSLYGFADATMPALERLARDGVVFDQAISVAPLTLPAHTSLFTGLFPPGHGVRDNAGRALDENHTTLAEVLRDRGYCTGAFVSSVVLDPSRGLAQGFEHYAGVLPGARREATPLQRRADEVVADAIRWFDGIGTCPLFLWTHFYDPHRPYEPPEPYRSRYFDPYIGEIMFVDAQIGRLLDALEQRHRLENAIVIVAADHGESLGEHGEEDHGIFVYESVLRVPLIVRLPGSLTTSGATGDSRVADLVRLVDVMPTVLDLLRIPALVTDGVSLTPLLDGSRNALGLEGYAESMYPRQLGWSSLAALRDNRFKFIQAPQPELYDLESDPFERTNIIRDHPAVAQTMSRRLGQAESRDERERTARSDHVDADVRARLAALGYAAGTSVAPLHAARPALDPKDCIAGYEQRRRDNTGLSPKGFCQ